MQLESFTVVTIDQGPHGLHPVGPMKERRDVSDAPAPRLAIAARLLRRSGRQFAAPCLANFQNRWMIVVWTPWRDDGEILERLSPHLGRPDFRRTAKERHRFLDRAQEKQRLAEIMNGRRLIGIESQATLERPSRLGGTIPFDQGAAQAVPRITIGGVVLDGLLIKRDRLGELA